MTRRSNPDTTARGAAVGEEGEAIHAVPRKKRLACFTIADKSVVLLGRETILRNGEPVGYLTSGGYGYTVDQPIGFGYVRNADHVSDEFLASGKYELVVANERFAANVHLEPLYDPGNERVRG